MISDHTDAATITPEVKPSSIFCSSAGMSRFIKNTKPDPRAVPRNGIINAVNTGLIIGYKLSFNISVISCFVRFR